MTKLKDEAREILASFEDDLRNAMKDDSLVARVQAIESALIVLLNALAEDE